MTSSPKMKSSSPAVNGSSSTEEAANSSSEPPKMGEDTPLISASNHSIRKKNCSSTNDSGGGILYCAALVIVLASALSALFCITFRLGTHHDVPIQVDFDFPYPIADHPLRPSRLWGNIKKPYPSGAWFTNLALGNGNMPVVVLPYTVKATSEGVGFSYSAALRTVTSERIQDTYREDILVSAGEEYENHKLLRSDNISVSVGFDYSGGRKLKTYLVRGSPYMTFEYFHCTPVLRTQSKILSINGMVPHEFNGELSILQRIFKIELQNFQTWIIYSSESIKLTLINGDIVASSPLTGMIRVALVPDGSNGDNEDILNRHAYAFAKQADVEFFVEGDTATMKYYWAKEGFGDLLMLALPHHLDAMDQDKVSLALPNSYQTMKGKMTGVVGSAWEMTLPLTNITWTSSKRHLSDYDKDDSHIKELLKLLKIDIDQTSVYATDIYGFGKQCSRTARLALIANELHEDELTNKALNVLENSIGEWLTGSNANLLIYDKIWGGVVTINGLRNQDTDFGNAWMNDHHSAVVNKFRPEFYQRNKKALDFIVLDFANMGDVDLFPTARHKDFFDGHSWASGLFPQANGKSQESISEAVNAYYAVHLWGLSIGDKRMSDWGRILLAMEVHSAHHYWQMKHDDLVYDSVFAANRMVGLVAALEVVHQTWFGSNEEYVSGINMLPFTPISENLLPYDFMAQLLPLMKTALDRVDDPPVPQWAGYLYLGQAMLEPAEARDSILALDIYDSANSKTNSLYWIATRPTPPKYDIQKYTFHEKPPEECQNNTACFAQGIKGQCCPDVNGTWLGCCPRDGSSNMTNGLPAECSQNKACMDQGMTVDTLCCPTLEGVFLACCETTKTSKKSKEDIHDVNGSDTQQETESSCSQHKNCIRLGLVGGCCPTVNVYMTEEARTLCRCVERFLNGGRVVYCIGRHYFLETFHEYIHRFGDMHLWDGSIGEGYRLEVEGDVTLQGVKQGDSIAVNGVCLTIEDTMREENKNSFTFGIAPETLRRSNLGTLKMGSLVNLERGLQTGARNSGHYVQGHVDCTGTILSLDLEGDSLWVKIKLQEDILRYLVPKGFVSVDGTSLTVCEVCREESWFNFMLVKHTQEHINIPRKSVGDTVNIEADVLGKYAEQSVTYLAERVASALDIRKIVENHSSILARLEALEKANAQQGGETVVPVPRQPYQEGSAVENPGDTTHQRINGRPLASEDIDSWSRGLEARVKNRDLVLDHIELRLGVLEEKLGSLKQ